MRSRKFMLMAVAITAVAVLAVPASAAAAEWLHEGKPFKEHVDMKLGGGEFVEIGEAGAKDAMLCESSNLTISTEGGSTGQASYEVKPASCMGLAGRLEGCTATAVKTTGTPWPLTVNAADVTAEGVGVNYTLSAGCTIKTIEVSFPKLTLTPREEPSSINLFQWNTEGSGKVNGETAKIAYFGSQSFPDAEAGKYGIG